jgi:hypothetical protein
VRCAARVCGMTVCKRVQALLLPAEPPAAKPDCHGKEGVIGSSPIEGFRQVQVDREVYASVMVASVGKRVQGASISQTARRSWAR